MLGIFWKSQNCWRQFNHSFNKCFLHHHSIYPVHLSPSKPKSQGGVSKHWRNPRSCSEVPANPIQGDAEQPSGCNKFCQLDRIPAWSSASWAMAETGCCPPDTPNLRLRQQCPSGVGNGVLITHPCSQVRTQQFFLGLSLLLLGWVSSVKNPGVTSTARPLFFFNYWEKKSNRNPSWRCRKQERGIIWGGNIGGLQKLKAGRQKRIRIFSAESKICHLSLLELVFYFWIELYVFNSVVKYFTHLFLYGWIKLFLAKDVKYVGWLCTVLTYVTAIIQAL